MLGFGINPVLLTPAKEKPPENFKEMDFDRWGMRGDRLDTVPLHEFPDLSQPINGVAQTGTLAHFYNVVEPVIAKGLSSVGRRSYRPVHEFPFQGKRDGSGKAVIGLRNDQGKALDITKVKAISSDIILSHSKGLVELSFIRKDSLITIGVLVGGTKFDTHSNEWIYFSVRFI